MYNLRLGTLILSGAWLLSTFTESGASASRCTLVIITKSRWRVKGKRGSVERLVVEYGARDGYVQRYCLDYK